MTARFLYTVARILQGILTAGALFFILMYVILAVVRLGYPYELEWMEGNTVEHVCRVLEGKPIYVSPSIDFVPSIYPPFYYYIGAAAAKITGIGFFPLRLVSFASSLLAFALIGGIVWKETKSRWAGIIAAGMFAATYRACGSWFDIARVDSLFLTLLLAAIGLLRFGKSRSAYIVAGLLAAASFLTKQTALCAIIPLVIFVLWKRRDRAAYFAGTFALVAGIWVLILNLASHGWFIYYTAAVPASHSWQPPLLLWFWTRDLSLAVPAMCFCAALVLLNYYMRRDSDRFWFYALAGAGMLAASYVSRIKIGNYFNDLIPVYAILSVSAGLALANVFMWAKAAEKDAGFPSDKRVPRAAGVLCMLLVLMQFLSLTYDPRAQLPTQADRIAGDRLIGAMRICDGDVWLPNHGYLPRLAGKSSCAHMQAMEDIIGAEDDWRRTALLKSAESALKAGRFRTLFLDACGFGNAPHGDDFEKQEKIFADDGVFFPVTGHQTRPEDVFVYRDSSASGIKDVK